MVFWYITLALKTAHKNVLTYEKYESERGERELRPQNFTNHVY